MRQQIDCAVLNLATHHVWVENMLHSAEHALTRIRIHRLDWELGLESALSSDQSVSLDVHAIAKAAVSLRRYDVCLIPVSLETLGWTRQALAAIPRGPFLPLIGMFNGLRSAAMQDLLELGLADFVRIPLCPDEFRARILSTVSRVPRPGSLREPEASCTLSAGATVAGLGQRPLPWTSARPISRPVRSSVRHSGSQHGSGGSKRQVTDEKLSFRASKSMIVEQFERDYITQALERHRGNIAMAARSSNKHRRAFWALMRKYQIDATPYRPDEDAE